MPRGIWIALGFTGIGWVIGFAMAFQALAPYTQPTADQKFGCSQQVSAATGECP